MNNRLQTALAILITKLHVLENYSSFREELITDLSLNEEEASTLDIFYNCNQNRFSAAARILKQNRWDDLKASLPLTTCFLEANLLEALWEDYLINLNIKDNPPKNPLVESIFFVLFAEQSPRLNLWEKELLKYERVRNEVTYQHHQKLIFYRPQNEELAETSNLEEYVIYMHECCRIEEFAYDILAIINKKHPTASKENCQVLFFKNLQQEGIGSLSLTRDGRQIIERANISKNLRDLYCFFAEQLSRLEFLRFLSKLAQLGVCVFQRRGK